MTMNETRKPEQWEALIVEPSHWRRNRDVDYRSSHVAFDAEDANLLDDGLQTEFRRIGGFDTHVKDIDRIDHPLARFYRLMYTDEFSTFRGDVYREGSGVAGMSLGVRELLMDQTFRYFVFVRPSPLEATRFGQLICSIAVFRNTYDDDSKKFIEAGIVKSRKRLFKPQERVPLSRDLSDASEYESLDDVGIPADYESGVARMIRRWMDQSPAPMEVLDMNVFGDVITDDIGLYSPLPVNTSAYSPSRTKLLHVMQVLGMYVPSGSGKIDVIYTGSLSSSILQMIREILPEGFRLFPTLDKLNPSNLTVIFIDDEANKESSASFGDDNLLIQQFTVVKALETAFRGKLDNLLAVSTNFRVPYTLSSPGRFQFLPGKILLTPWKNPQDERRRLVWTPELGSDLVEYSVSPVQTSRKMVDYVLRTLVRVTESPKLDVESPGLIDGEFDSELERLIVSRFYESFSFGSKSWMEVASDDVITFPRFVGEEPMFMKVALLDRFFKFVIDYHVSIPSNPLISHVSRCSRSGLFSFANLADSPLKDSMSRLFGIDGSDMMKAFVKVEADQKNVILAIRERNIFPRVREKTVAYSMIKEIVPRFSDIVFFEPALGRNTHNFVYDILGRGDDRSVVLIHLGDTFGNTLYETVENLSYMRVRIGEIAYESSFAISDIWKNISPDNIPFKRLKNAFALNEYVEKSRSPVILIRGYGYPENIFESVVKSLSSMDLYMGYVHVVDQQIVPVPNRKPVSPSQILARVVSDAYISRMRDDQNSAMVIGSEYEFDLSFLGTQAFKRIFHVVESGAGGRRVSTMMRKMPKVTSRVFVLEDLVSNFVIPVQGVMMKTIIINQAVFSRIMSSKDNGLRFLQELKKVMDSFTTVIVLNFESLWEYMTTHGKKILDGTGMVFESPLISGSVSDMAFHLPGVSGIRYQLSTVADVCNLANVDFHVRSNDELPEPFDEPYGMSSSNPMENLSPYSLARMIKILSIKTHYDYSEAETSEPFHAYEGRSVDMGVRVRSYNNLVKRGLIEESKNPSRVLDLACGHGQDIPKWFSQESVDMYVGMDASQPAIREAENRLRTRKGFKPRFVRMVQSDVFGSQGWVFDAEDYLRSRSRYTTISCQLAIHYAFKDEKTIKRFMHNVSRLLEMGGEFIVTTIDSQSLKRMLGDKSLQVISAGDTVQIKGEFFQIKMSMESYNSLLNDPVVIPGISYEFIQFPSDPQSRTTTEYVVDVNYFKQLAEDMGMRLVQRMNFLNAEDKDSIDFSSERSQLMSEDRELIGLYASYRFEKVVEVKEYLPEEVRPLSITESMQLFQTTMNVLSLGTAEKLGNFTHGLFLTPRDLFPAPYVSTGYDRMDIITDDIGDVVPLYRQLKFGGKVSDRENVYLSRVSRPDQVPYNLVYLPHTSVDTYEGHLESLAQDGSIYGTFVSMETADRVLLGESEFANAVFELFVDRTRKLFSINSSLETTSYPLLDASRLRTRVNELGLTFEMISAEDWQTDSKLSLPQKQFLSIFGMFRITKSKPLEIPVQPFRQPEPEEPVIVTGESVDKFVLLPGLVQKKAPGKGRDETLSSPGTTYKDLARDSRWRFKLSDDWESNEFPIRMTSGHMFTSVTNAMIYYKCEFVDEENKEYLGLNISSGLPVPVDVKPFTKAIRGKKGQQWKEREPEVLREVYEAKFTNTPNSNDDAENLTPLRALLLTRDAHLYSNSRTRNELLERVRDVLRRIVGTQ